MTARARQVKTGRLEIAYEESGPADGAPIILSHGFPDDVRTWDGIAPALARRGHRVLVPYLRGYGPTRFLDPAAPRSGEQAALGHDLIAFMDALGIARALLVGYDWGGRASCIVSALWPERVSALVSIGGYNIQNLARGAEPLDPRQEFRYWYWWYFHTERGVAGLERNRRDLCRLLWELWSPNWRFDEATFERTAPSFDNPDFVAVSVHSYRHRVGNAPGDPEVAAVEARLALQPTIRVPTVVLHGESDGVTPPADAEIERRRFAGPYRRRVVPVAGHFLPREAPEVVIEAVAELRPSLSLTP